LVKEAELVRGAGPDFGDDAGVEGRAVGDDLRRLDPGSAKALEEGLNGAGLDRAGDEFVANQAIALGGGRIDGHERREAPLVPFVDAQDAGEAGVSSFGGQLPMSLDNCTRRRPGCLKSGAPRTTSHRLEGRSSSPTDVPSR
jgi:hypothetical protein